MLNRRIDLWAPPFRGHLHPMLAIARTLSQIGMEVRVFSTPLAQAEISASGIAGSTILENEEATIQSVANPAQAIRSQPRALLGQFRSALSVLESLHRAAHVYYQNGPRPDLVIVDSVLPSAGLAAAQCGLTWWTSTPSPCAIEPLEGTPGYLGGWNFREDLWGRLRDRTGIQLVKYFKRAVHRVHRKRLVALGVPNLYRANGEETIYSSARILGLGLPEFEFPRRWPRAFHWIGPMLYTPPNAAPAEAAPSFDSGKKHVLVTLGTHLAWMKDDLARVVENFSSRFPDVIFHFSDGRPGKASPSGTGAFRRYAYIPYEPYLPQFDLIVHHGGAGVLYQAIRAAIPCVVFPVDYDQFDHAARVRRCGIGRTVKTLDKLEAAVREALQDPQLKVRCRSLQAHYVAFNPEERLRTAIANHFESPPPVNPRLPYSNPASITEPP